VILFETIAVFGVGLLGGSIGLAVKKQGLAHRVIGLGRNMERLREAQSLGAVDTISTEPEKAISADCGLVVVCTPVSRIPEIVNRFLPLVPEKALITDVGSTKRILCQRIEKLTDDSPGGPSFIGSHPMAGSEKTGVQNARADLYQGAACIITPDEGSPAEAVQQITLFWDKLGCRVLQMSAGQHDRLVATGSHVPHLAATALSLLLGETAEGCPQIHQILGEGFRDTTRVAAGDPLMWRDICLDNAEAVSQSLDRLIEHLEKIRTTVREKNGDGIEQLLREGQKIRQRVGNSTKSPPSK
jgi:prephenate dehydrogenase